MTNNSITHILAANLAYFMQVKGKTQKELGKTSRVGQTTISLYLNPDSRNPTSNGKLPSPVLAKVNALADALGIELWELLRPLTPAERELIKSVDAVIAEKTRRAPMPATNAAIPKPQRVRRVSATSQKRHGQAAA